MTSEQTRIVIVRQGVNQTDSLSELLRTTVDMDLIGAAETADAGLALVKQMQPDIVLVEGLPELPVFIHKVLQVRHDTGVILLCRREMNLEANQSAVDSLAAGAFDIVLGIENIESIRNLLLSKIRCCSIKQFSRQVIFGKPTQAITPQRPKQSIQARALAIDAIFIGVSTGGPEALMALMPALPSNLPVPLVIVLHMPKDFTGPMAEALNRKSRLSVSEAKHGETLESGHAYLAPGGRHCQVRKSDSHGLEIVLDDGLPENGCRPSVDVLFRSATAHLGQRALGIILTGMGNDGMRGAGLLKQAGATILVQDEASSVVWGMPGSVVRAGFADEVLPLDQIAGRILDLLGGSHATLG